MGPDEKENKGKAVLYRKVLENRLPKSKETPAVPAGPGTPSPPPALGPHSRGEADQGIHGTLGHGSHSSP